MIIKSNPHGKGGNIVPSFPVEVKEEKVQPIIEEVEEKIDNPDDGEGEG